MFAIPTHLQERFDTKLHDSDVPEKIHTHYRKWLRFYLDFCSKYHTAPDSQERLAPFLRKLEEKKQTEWQRKQPSHAVSLFYELLRSSGAYPAFSTPMRPPVVKEKTPKPYHHNSSPAAFSASKQFSPSAKTAASRRTSPTTVNIHPKEVSRPSALGTQVSISAGPHSHLPGSDITKIGASWKSEFAKLSDEIKLRHYSPRTLKTYRHWVRNFQAFLRSKAPEALDTTDVKEYLTWLAVKR